MTDKTDSKEREAFEAHYRQLGANEATLSRWVDDGVIPPAMVGKYIIRIVQDAWLAFQAGRASVHIDLEDMATASAQGFRDGVASLAASAGGEPVAWRVRRHDAPNYWIVFLHRPVDAMADPEREVQPLYTHPSPPEGMVGGWISVDERLPEVGVTVLVYEPFRHGEDWPGAVRISFDHICPDYEDWHDHCASYEHFMAVGGVNACGPDVTCTGPSEKAPYTHWMPLPPPPTSAADSGEGE